MTEQRPAHRTVGTHNRGSLISGVCGTAAEPCPVRETAQPPVPVQLKHASSALLEGEGEKHVPKKLQG